MHKKIEAEEKDVDEKLLNISICPRCGQKTNVQDLGLKKIGDN